MNDLELDEMLEKWTVPPVSANLLGRVRAGYSVRPERKRTFWPRWRVFAGALAGMAIVLAVVTQAFPQKIPAVHAPYTVYSKFITYDDSGAPTGAMYSTSYAIDGKESVLSRSYSDPLTTAFWQTAEALGRVVSRLTLPLMVSPEQLQQARQAYARPGFSFAIGRGFQFQSKSGPGCADGPVVAHETILGHSADAYRAAPVYVSNARTTLWMAPDLGCFALRVTVEVPRPDGSFHLMARKQAVSVTMSR